MLYAKLQSRNDTTPTKQNDAVALNQQAADLFKTTNGWFQLCTRKTLAAGYHVRNRRFLKTTTHATPAVACGKHLLLVSHYDARHTQALLSAAASQQEESNATTLILVGVIYRRQSKKIRFSEQLLGYRDRIWQSGKNSKYGNWILNSKTKSSNISQSCSQLKKQYPPHLIHHNWYSRSQTDLAIDLSLSQNRSLLTQTTSQRTTVATGHVSRYSLMNTNQHLLATLNRSLTQLTLTQLTAESSLLIQNAVVPTNPNDDVELLTAETC
ncbi:hypothetical protein F511_38859 [Dorcoceras hygrometricum]|uniref:Uncharacterized protein n=1 Tax=Dorcoceras hygrometricum TaxID=472368 RepID=A0A2Z7B2N5_9LAMI|nr:hypothetical protein F511_38859 [Dorcoceras hygrometricum]